MNIQQIFTFEKEGRLEEALRLIRDIKERSKVPYPRGIIDVTETRLEFKIERRKTERKAPSNTASAATKGSTNAAATWTAIICMWKRTDYLAEQLAAIRSQSIAPTEIIIIINENFIDKATLAKFGNDLQVIHSDINSLYTRWAAAYVCRGEYVAVFDDDTIPGSLFIENAIRASHAYNALVGGSGRIYNTAGVQGFYEIVAPEGKSTANKLRDCSRSDVHCDWVCNVYVFKRDWAQFALSNPRFKGAQKTFDDIQLATSLYAAGGIGCVVPVQPVDDTRLHASLKRAYGNDKHAIWLTNSEKHFAERREFIEHTFAHGYTPVNRRETIRFHLIVPFADHQYLERCLLSLKAQVYQNFTCTVVDDCGDGNNSIALMRKIGCDTNQYSYLIATKKMFSLRAREAATDFIDANLADVVVHLDGDDWLPDPLTLSRLNQVYLESDTAITYGNAINKFETNAGTISSFGPTTISKRWNVSQSEPEAPVLLFRRLHHDDIGNDWKTAPWGALHLRTFRYVDWQTLPRAHFKADGDYLRVATDAAIMLPILSDVAPECAKFIPDLMYVYRNGSNTIHGKNVTSEETRDAAKRAINDADFGAHRASLTDIVLGRVKPRGTPNDFEELQIPTARGDKFCVANTRVDTSRNPAPANRRNAVVTIVTPNYLGDALLCLRSFVHHTSGDFDAIVYLATTDAEALASAALLARQVGVTLLHPESLEHGKEMSNQLMAKYAVMSDEYRWAMKSVMLAELLKRDYHLAVFQDPDTYTVNNLDDTVARLENRSLYVFPHFRDPDDNYLRKVLYRDGFFNGGMIAATSAGYAHLVRFYERCLKQMIKDPELQRWDDQKYMDLMVLESDDVGVNLDRGIDYNPWNYEPIEAWCAPSQRSYLIKSGFYVRHWHVSTNMIKQTQENHPRHIVYKPICIIYLHSLLVTILFILSTLRRAGDKNNLGLPARFERITQNLKALTGGAINLAAEHEILEKLTAQGALNAADLTQIESKLMTVVQESVSFDNIELFHDLFKDYQVRNGVIGMLHPDAAGSALTAARLYRKALHHDAAHLCYTQAVAKGDISEADVRKELDAGRVLVERLDVLRQANVNF